MKTNLALKIGEVRRPAQAVTPIHIVKPKTAEPQVRPLNMSLDFVVMGGERVPIVYKANPSGYRTWDYDPEKKWLIMSNLDRGNTVDQGKIREYILTALSNHGNPNDFWETYWKARGV